MRFVRGVIDSNDLPLNISREILQSNKIIDSMRGAIIKRVLSMLEDLALDDEKYKKFWQQFGQVMKEGPAEDFANQQQIAKLLRFEILAHIDTSDKSRLTHLHISRMPATRWGFIMRQVTDTFTDC